EGRAGPPPPVPPRRPARAAVAPPPPPAPDRLWGTADPAAVRALLPEPAVLVVKGGEGPAVAFERPRGTGGQAAEDEVTTVPAPRVDVLASVGAGDGFAAGYLSAALRGLGARARLRHGHLAAAAALTAPGDLAAPPRRAHADRLAALDEHAWGRLHLGPGWTSAGTEADEEVRTG
ncbi:PfkB family carbohydrate kinase, partial [Streptomyces sp. NPDC127049]|uniref:PfkB family carbohydrate kinase n=1 Tax=Streptomyces sp. NPDC127049 TaxID=3347118 RepID=UPI003654F639